MSCQIFKCQFAVGQLLVYCRPRVGRQYTDRLLGELFFTFTLNSAPVKTKYYFVAFVIITPYCCYSKIKCSLLLPPMSSSSLFCKNSIPPYQSGLASLQLSACVVAVFHLKKIIIISSFELITAKGANISQPMDIEQNCAKNFHSGWDRCEIWSRQKTESCWWAILRVWKQSAWQECKLSNKWARDLLSKDSLPILIKLHSITTDHYLCFTTTSWQLYNKQ